VLGEGDEINIVVRGRGRDMIAGEVAAFAATAGDGAIEAEALARAALVLN
jgi:glutamate synthase domain-containing protein 3